MSVAGRPIDVPVEIARLRDAGALFALSDSGGKDSQAMRLAVLQVVPPSQAMSSGLGPSSTPKPAPSATGLPFVVARARKTFFEMVEHRFKVRPGPNSSCWPSAENLYERYVELERRTGYTMHQSRQPLQVLAGVEVSA